MMKSIFVAIILIFGFNFIQSQSVGLPVALSGASNIINKNTQNQLLPIHAHKDITPVDLYQGRFSVNAIPKLNSELDIIFTIKPIDNFSNLKVKLFIEEGIELPVSQLDFEMAGKKEIESSHTFRVKIAQRGVLRIEASVIDSLNIGTQRSYFIFIDSKNGTVSRSNTPEKKFEQMNTKEQQEFLQQVNKEDISSLVISDNNKTYGPAGTVSITGSLRYEEIGTSTHKPVRYATVRVYKAGLLWDDEIGIGYTNSAGSFAVPVTCTGSTSIYVKIYNENSVAKGVPGCNVLGCSPYYTRLPNSGSVNLNCGLSSYNIGDVYLSSTYSSWQAVDNVLTEADWLVSDASGWTRNQVTVIFPTGTWPNSNGNEINLPDRATAAWNQIVIFHEYAHCIMFALYGSFPGSCSLPSHRIMTAACEEFALTEGWATFLAGAVLNDPNVWIDKVSDCSNPPNNLETNNWWKGENCANTNGAIVEGTITSVLWDIYDSPTADDDGLQLGFNNSSGSIWGIMKNNRPQSITAFWNSWRSQFGYGQQLWKVFNANGINKDNIAPGNPISVNSPSHPNTNYSYSDNTIDMNWSAGTDDLSGVAGYSWEWSTSSTTIPDAILDGTGTSTTSPALANGNNWYFHIRSKDNAGNWNSGAIHKGPYYINTIPTCLTLSNNVYPNGSGSISINTQQNCSAGYASGTTISISASPLAGFIFSSWSGSGGQFANNNSSSTTFTITGNASITANFTQVINCYTLSSSMFPVNGGSVTINTQRNCTNGFNSGTSVPITATPASGYTFASWSGSSGQFANVNSLSTIFTINGNANIIANFSQVANCDTLAVSTEPVNAGSITINTDQNCSGGYNSGTVISLSANSYAGYAFSGWTSIGGGTFSNPALSTTNFTLSSNASVIANYTTLSQPCNNYALRDSIKNLSQPLLTGIYGSKLYVSSSLGRAHIINLNSNSLISTITFGNYTGSYGGGIAFLNGKAYIPLRNLGSNAVVAIIDTMTNMLTGYIPVSADPYAITTFNNKLYVSHLVCWTNGNPATIDVIDPTSNSIITTFSTVSCGSNDIIMVPALNKAFTANAQASNISIINLSSNSVVDSINVSINPRSLVYTNNCLYVAGSYLTNSNGKVLVINPSTKEIISQITVGREPVKIASFRKYIFVTNQSDHSVSVINTESNSVISTIFVGSDPTGISASQTSGKIYVANQGSTSISMIACTDNVTQVDDTQDISKLFLLSQNFPNPFNPTTVINYQLTTAVHVTLKIYNLLGKEIETLVDGFQSPGFKSVTFNAEHLENGVYLYKLQAGNFSEVKKLVLLK